MNLLVKLYPPKLDFLKLPAKFVLLKISHKSKKYEKTERYGVLFVSGV